MQVDFKRSNQTSDVMAERIEALNQENAQLKSQLRRVAFMIHNRRSHNSNSGTAIMALMLMVAAVIVLIYGMGIFEISLPSLAEYDEPVVERMR